MASLQNQSISTSYGQLLKTVNAGGIDGALQAIEDGDGTTTALELSSAGVRSTGTLNVAGATTLSSSLSVTGTSTLTAASITNGTIVTLNTTTGTITGLSANSITSGTSTSTAASITNGTIVTLNTTTGTITGLSANSITSGTGTAGTTAIAPIGDLNTGLFFPSSDTIAASTNGTERIRIDSSGRVGIGTTTPAQTLDVSGVILSTGALASLSVSDRTTGTGQKWIIYSSSDILRFFTGLSDRVQINASGDLLIVQPALIGYGTGSGGTVTQGTSKTTGVTLNKPTGQITMNNAALAGGASASFALTNSFISAVDVLLVNATAFGNYTVDCVNTSTGAATIRVTNISAGSLSDALTIQFAVIKGATA